MTIEKKYISFSIIFAVVVLAFLGACSRDKCVDVFNVQIETLVGQDLNRAPQHIDSKMTFRGKNLSWQDDDAISVYAASSRATYKITTGVGMSQAEFTHVAGDEICEGPFSAVYPASIRADAATVDLPAIQTSADGSLTSLPMYAVGHDENLVLHHLCGVARFVLSASSDISISSIAVTADVNINGRATIVGEGKPLSINAADGTSTTTLSITTPQSIAPLHEFYMYLPAGTYNTFEITITALDGTVYTKGELSNIDIGRARVTTVVLDDNTFVSTTPEGALPRRFSVGENRTVLFSRGNLQYQASTNTWRFAGNQYDIMGDDNQYISPTYNGWIDLFGWGTSGWNSGANAYLPYSTSNDNYDYYPGGSESNNLTGEYANADWGVYNAITNGGNEAGLWRTLSDSEWSYLFTGRAAAFSKFGYASVSGVNGVVVLPDRFTDPMTNNGNRAFLPGGPEWTGNVYTADGWAAMETAGALFLPAAGSRDALSVGSVGVNGYYWSTTSSGNGVAASLFFTEGYLEASSNFCRISGLAVRLVRD